MYAWANIEGHPCRTSTAADRPDLPSYANLIWTAPIFRSSLRDWTLKLVEKLGMLCVNVNPPTSGAKVIEKFEQEATWPSVLPQISALSSATVTLSACEKEASSWMMPRGCVFLPTRSSSTVP